MRPSENATEFDREIEAVELGDGDSLDERLAETSLWHN